MGAGDSNQNGPNRQFAKGLSRFHTPHRFTLNGSWRMPFFEGRTDLVGILAGGWHGLGRRQARVTARRSPMSDTGGRDLELRRLHREARPILLDASLLGASVDGPGHVAHDPRWRATSSAPRSSARTISSSGATRSSAMGWRPSISGSAESFRFSWRRDLIVRFEAYNVLNKVQDRLSHRRLRQCNVRTDRRRRGHLCAADVSGRAEVSLLEDAARRFRLSCQRFSKSSIKPAAPRTES